MPFKIKADWRNRKVIIKTDMLGDLTRKGIRAAYYELGKDLVKESRNLINKKPKHGRLYKIMKKGSFVMHRASAPGEAPAVITGRTRSSIDFQVQGGVRMLFGARRNVKLAATAVGVGFTAKGLRRQIVNYPAWLEEGTSRMKARPYLLPSIKNNYRNAERHFQDQIKKAIIQ